MTIQLPGSKSPASTPRPQYIVEPVLAAVSPVRYSTPLPSNLDYQPAGSGPVSMFDAPTPEPETMPSGVMAPLPATSPKATQPPATPAEVLPPAPAPPTPPVAPTSPPPQTPGSIPAQVFASPADPESAVFASLLTPVTHVSGGEPSTVGTSKVSGSSSSSTETAPPGPADSPVASVAIPPASVAGASPAVSPMPTSVRNIDEFDFDGVCSSRFLPGS